MASYEKRPDGKWSVRFRAFVNGEEKNKRLSGFRTRKEAEKAYADYLNGTIQPKTTKDEITMRQLIGEYTAYKKTRNKQSTVYDQQNRINNHIAPYFNDQNVKDITPLDIVNWQARIADYSHEYKISLWVLLGSIFAFGEKFYDLPNPCKKVDAPRDSETPPQELRIWTVRQFDRFLDVLEREQINFEEIAFYKVLFYCGLRKGEAMALKWEDYDQTTGRLRINKSITTKIEGKAWSVTTPKNKHSIRKILVPVPVRESLEKLYVGQKKTSFIFGYDRPLPIETIRRHFLECTKKADLPIIRFHDLRHSCASYLLSNENGQSVSPVAVAKYLGHNVETLLKTYAHLLPSGEEEIVKKFDCVGTKLGTQE